MRWSSALLACLMTLPLLLPGPDAAPATQIDQYLTDLLRFRDDAHLAAWVNLGVDGRTWDAFSAVWREDNISAASLAETLSNRNFTADDYAASRWLASGTAPASPGSHGTGHLCCKWQNPRGSL